MKYKTLLISVVFIFLLIILSNSFGQKELEWKGDIEFEKGVKVIKNPKEPLYGNITFELEEDLSIGNEDDENYLFYKVGDIQVDTDGNIYVLDSGNHRLQVFNKNGNYIRTLGKRGQGPGEFNTPVRLQLDDKKGNIYVADNILRKIIIFDKEGKYIDKDIPLVEILSDFCLDSESSIWGKFYFPGMDTYHFIKKVNLTGKVEKTFIEIPYYDSRLKLSYSKVGNTSYMGGYFFTHGYEHDIFLSKIDNHTFIYGNSKKYELIKVDITGETIFIMRKDETPKEITNSEKERVKNRIKGNLMKKGYYVPEISINFPKYMPYFYSIITDNKGRIYVRKNPLPRYSSVNHEYDLYNKEGLYLYKIHLDHYPDVINNGYIYTRISDEETGEEQIKRYKIKNWDQINTQSPNL